MVSHVLYNIVCIVPWCLDFLGVNFWSRDFLGLDFWLHSIIPVTWNPEYPPPPWPRVHTRPSSVFILSAVSYGKKQFMLMARLPFSIRVDFSQLIYLRFFLSITLTKLAWMVWMFAVSSSRTTVRRDVTKTRNGERARGTVKWKMRQPALDVNSVVLTGHLSATVLRSAWNFVAELPLNRHHF